jgi:hypothetical protein
MYVARIANAPAAAIAGDFGLVMRNQGGAVDV